MKPRTLVGKRLVCWVDLRGHAEQRTVRVLRTHVDRRSGGRQISGVTAALFSPFTRRYDGVHVRLTPRAWAPSWAGVVYRKRVVPVAEFLGLSHPSPSGASGGRKESRRATTRHAA